MHETPEESRVRVNSESINVSCFVSLALSFFGNGLRAQVLFLEFVLFSSSRVRHFICNTSSVRTNVRTVGVLELSVHIHFSTSLS